MKINKTFNPYLIPLLVLFILSGVQSHVRSGTIDEMTLEMDSLNITIEEQQEEIDSVNSVNLEIQEVKFSHVFDRFKYFNKDIDSATVSKFIEVVEMFDLDTTRELLDIMISQICLESRGRQFDESGNVVESSGNALGFGQIVPTTGFHYLKHMLKRKDKKMFKELGCGNMGFINFHIYKRTKNDDGRVRKYIGPKTRVAIKRWLSDPINNITLWGFIMRDNMTNSSLDKSLIAYKDGVGWLSRFLKEGNNPREHSYVKKVKSITRILNSKV